MKRMLFTIAAVSMLATPTWAATHCRDAKGKFMKCAEKTTTTTHTKTVAAKTVKKCRNAKGQFTKC